MKVVLLLVGLLGYASALRRDLFGSTTAYQWIQSNDVAGVTEDELKTVHTSDGGTCTAVQFTGVLRHGSRYPYHSDISEMSDLHHSIRHRIVSKHHAIESWSNRFHSSQGYELTATGATEHKGLGSRFAKRLKTLFNSAKSSTEYVSSSKDRSIDSAKNFHIGVEQTLLGAHAHVPHMSPHVDNHRTRFYDSCPKWRHSVYHNHTVIIEEHNFHHGRVIDNLTNYVNQELFGHHHYCDSNDVRLMMKYCAYEMGLYGSSVWCAIFQDWELEAEEYMSDLFRWYVWSYGHQINYGQSCPLIQDIFTNMDHFVNDDGHHRLINKFLFGHGETIFPLSAALGLFKDSTSPRADNFEAMKNRKYVSSKIAPFAGNIAFVLYKCDKPVTTTSVKQYQSNYAVRLFSNENENEFPGCNTKLCPYTFMREKLGGYIDHCDFNERCRVGSDPGIIG